MVANLWSARFTPTALSSARRAHSGRRVCLVVPVLLLAAAPALAQTKSEAQKTENRDGSTSLTFSNEISQFGAKLGVAVTEPAANPLADPVAGQQALSGAAFAHIRVNTLPDWWLWQKGAVDVTVNPAEETSKVATTFSRTVELHTGLKATLSDQYAFEHGASAEAWTTDKSVSLKVEDMGTTFSVAAKGTQDQDWLPSVSAQQQLLGGLSVTTSVADTGSELNRSITAGFKHRW